jgi:hypothetical protein
MSTILGKGQKQQNYFQPAVPPLSNTTLRLPGGDPGMGPNYYSLGIQSTVPFVTLEGGGSSQKEFSWGELIEVKEGQQVTVKNSSYMKGDVEIVSGLNYSAKPERISVAVEMLGDPLVPGTQFRAAFPADTRRCRKAYFVCDVDVNADPLVIAIRGLNKKHSVTSEIDGTTFPVPAYFTGLTIAPNTTIGQIPLGFGLAGGLIPNSPMALFDTAEFSLIVPAIPFTINFPMFMYVLEY